jgi:hypothetical protein
LLVLPVVVFDGRRPPSSSPCRGYTDLDVADLALFAVPFVLAISFMGQAVGSFFVNRETAVLVFVATTLRSSFSSASPGRAR